MNENTIELYYSQNFKIKQDKYIKSLQKYMKINKDKLTKIKDTKLNKIKTGQVIGDYLRRDLLDREPCQTTSR